MSRLCVHCHRYVERSDRWYALRGDKPILHSGRCEDAWKQEQRELDAEEERAKLVLGLLGEPVVK